MSRFVIGREDGDFITVPVGGVGVQFKVEGEQTRGSVAIVEHPVPPGAFAMPHTHTLEDEISYVLEGHLSAEIDGEEVTVEAGQYLFKPRGLKHAFWNPSDRPARIIEIIAPAGLEQMFRTAAMLQPTSGTEAFERGRANMAEHGIKLHFDEAEAFLARHALQRPALPLVGGGGPNGERQDGTVTADVWQRADPLVLQADEGWTVRPGSDVQGDRFIVSGRDSAGRFAVVTHPVEAGWFSPPHTHSREDEYSYILEGRFGFEIGDREFEAGPGSLVFKPRDVRHAFWNLDAARGLILEIVSPAGLEGFFQKALELFEGGMLPTPEATSSLARTYGCEVDVAGTPAFLARHGLRPPGPVPPKPD
jgi:quercetin dioxygenase-like cupin family protein